MSDHVQVTRHDLAHPLGSAASHRAQRDVRPITCYCLATAPRNGSTLLSAALWASGLLGRPEEYLRPEDVPRWAAEWGMQWPHPGGWPEYLAAMASAATTPNGVCGFKLFPPHVMALPEDVFASPAQTFGVATVKMVHLRRRDKVRAGISEWKAQMSGQWVRLPGEPKVAPPRPPRDEEITKYHEFQHAWDRFWCASRADGIEWIELFYEDVVEDLPGAVDRIAALVGVEGIDHSGIAVRTRRQAEPSDDDWIRRWVEASGGCAECGHPSVA